MDGAEIQHVLDDVCDQAIVYHGFADDMRDYEILVYCTADPNTGVAPETVRLLFKNCVVANVETALTVETWQRSLDDRLIDDETGADLDGYVWGVKWQLMYPGGIVAADSPVAARWSESLGVVFHEVHMKTSGHNIVLVFSDLVVSVVEAGYSPFTVRRSGPDFKMPSG